MALQHVVLEFVLLWHCPSPGCACASRLPGFSVSAPVRRGAVADARLGLA